MTQATGSGDEAEESLFVSLRKVASWYCVMMSVSSRDYHRKPMTRPKSKARPGAEAR